MHRLVPSFIQEQKAAGNISGAFDACALFVDILGFTPITEAIMGHGPQGAEVLANIIQEVFDPLVQSIFEQDGFVTNFAGDAFTAVFPSSNSSDPFHLRALAAAWQIQEVMAGTGSHHTPYGDFEVSVKVGLSVGDVAWGIISSEDEKRSAYYFQGQAIEKSAEAEKHAQSGDVIIDPTLFATFGSVVSAVPVDDYYRITGVKTDLPSSKPIIIPPVDPELLVKFFPPEATTEYLSAEFRQVASMFVNLPTLRTEEQLRKFTQIVFDLQDRYGGMLNRLNFGDKGASLLLFWGAPVAYENDVTRALNFILDLQSKTVIPVKAGITYSNAHGGYSGGALAGEYTCHGRGTSLAARFMETSPRGEVWVDEKVAALGKRHFEIDPEGEMSFKGFSEEQKVFVLLERKEETEPLFDSQMVGRQVEQEKLLTFIQPLWQGHYPGMMLISGEPGIGKSRLVHAFLETLAHTSELEFSVFVCQTDDIFRESLNPFRYWLRRYFGQSEQQSDARNKRSFNRKLDRLIAASQETSLVIELDRTRSFLGALVNLHWPDSLYEQLDAQGRFENSFTGLLTLLRAESLLLPVILLIEDAHSLDRDSASFLRQLTLDQTGERAYPIAIIATARPGVDQTQLGDGIEFEQLNLDQLSPDDQALLAADLLDSPISAGFRDLLIERAEGNPFFAEQIIRYLKEKNLLILVGDEWQLREIHEAALPSSVRAVMVARIDRLTQGVKEVVQTASVLGREFEIQLLSRMRHDDPELIEMISQAEEMSIWSALSELRYLFKHALLRDAAYRMQIRSRRQSLHSSAVDAFENVYAGDLTPHYGELAYHAEQAGLSEKARNYLESAGDGARDAFQNGTAIDYYGRALKLTPDEDLESRYRLLLVRVKLHHRLGASQDQVRELDLMFQLAEQLEDPSKMATVLIQRAWMHWWTAEYELALSYSLEATALAEAAGDTGLAAEAEHASSWALIQRGEYAEARKLSEKALAGARQSGERRLEASVHSALGLINRVEGDFYAGWVSAEEALAINRSIGNWVGEGTTLGNLGVAYMTLGDYEAAMTCFRQALLISRETGSKASAASDLINHSWNAQTQGDWEPAIEYGQEGIAIARGASHTEMEAEGLIWLGHAWLGLGHPHKAIDAYQDSLRHRRELDQENLAMEVLAGLARAAVALGDTSSASGYVAEIMSFLERGGSLAGTWEPLRSVLTCYRVLELVQDPQAGEVLDSAYRQLWKWAEIIPDDEVRRIYLENVPWHQEIVELHLEMASGK